MLGGGPFRPHPDRGWHAGLGTEERGGGGGGVSGLKTVAIPLTGSVFFPGAKGTATVTFNSAQSYRSLDFEITNVNLPGGCFLEVDFLDDAVTATVGTYYNIHTIDVPQTAGIMMVRAAACSLVLANGNPNMALFGRNGSIMVSAIDSTGNIITVLSGSYSSLGQTPGQP